jgi:ribosomal protein S18 acetylase RimI-like enzyme
VEVRDATAADMTEVGDVRVAAYVAGGHLARESGYAPRLRSLGTDGLGFVLVAVDTGANAPSLAGAGKAGRTAGTDLAVEPTAGAGMASGVIAGTIMLRAWPDAGELLGGPGDAEIRALAVRPEAQGSGVGRLLLSKLIERATQLGVRHLLLSTQPDMRSAHRLYEQAGFGRLPDRDWSPEPGVELLVYGLRLA